MKYLITGHTGFKGAWLAVLLKELGHEVLGLSDTQRKSSLYATGELSKIFSKESFGDVADAQALERAIEDLKPDYIFHLAAQPLVSYSYLKPMETMTTNVTGTLNVLELYRKSNFLNGITIVTTDKVYKPSSSGGRHKESDPLGGNDPYSASKAMADILAQSYVKSFGLTNVNIVRAGNVIGGGDDSRDRLIPDFFRAVASKSSMKIRNPKSVRPWQHVLDCLYGYFTLAESTRATGESGIWNIGPTEGEYADVITVINHLQELLGSDSQLEIEFTGEQFLETDKLALDSSKALSLSGWKNRLELQAALEWTSNWYLGQQSGKNIFDLTANQVREYLALNE